MNAGNFDAVVVGAGPAGSATAALLAERGFKVALVERAIFPRPKPCAEYLSPEASRLLDRLLPPGVLAAEHPAELHGMRITSPDGTSFTGRFAGEHHYRGYIDHGIGLPREILDSHLANAAVARGATLVEGTTVDAFVSNGQGSRHLVLRSRKRRHTVTGRLVIGADGMNSRIASHLGLSRRGGLRRLALTTHAVGVEGMQPLGEMHVGTTGYCGLAPIGHGVTNVAAVADLDRGNRRKDPRQWLHDLLQEYPAVAERLANARFISPVRAVGPFARWTQRATDDRVLLVGDAADFYDPFTGQGIYAALRGAELAAEHASHALERDRLRAGDLKPYDLARRVTFGGKWIVERIVSWVIRRPFVINRVARRLAARPTMADLLVGVTGDFVPPGQVLKPSYVLQLIR